MASSPASPPPSCVRPGTGLGLAFTANCPIPQGSVLRSNARRVVQHSTIKEVLAAQQHTLVAGALDHIGLMDQVNRLQAENTELKGKVREITEQLNEAQERVDAAEAKAAKALDAAAQVLPAESAALHGDAMALDWNQASKAQLIERLQELENELLHTQQDRRQAHNQLVELRGAVRVLCRIRPLPQTSCAAPAVHALPDTTSVSVNCYGQDTTFAYSRVFGPGSTQAQLFTEVSEVVQSALDGYHVCLMSYGPTGSGKTYSMLGEPGSHSQEQQGIIPRAVDKLMHEVRRLGRQGWSYTLQVSCMEIYNNGIRDLLVGNASRVAGSQAAADTAAIISDMNAIKHDDSEGTSVVGISRHAISSTDQALALLQQAGSSRQVHGTNCNNVSSRSHCVFWMHVRGKHAKEDVQLSGALCLVDLAGSERLERSGAVGERKAEAAAINTSLSALGDVFTALSSKTAHVPYRNSKLTYLLKPCLSRGGKTLFLVHINPEQPAAHESLTSLRFATKVAGTELGQAKKNISSSQTLPQLPAQQPAAGAHSSTALAPNVLSAASAAPAPRRAVANGNGKAARSGTTAPTATSAAAGSAAGAGAGAAGAGSRTSNPGADAITTHNLTSSLCTKQPSMLSQVAGLSTGAAPAAASLQSVTHQAAQRMYTAADVPEFASAVGSSMDARQMDGTLQEQLLIRQQSNTCTAPAPWQQHGHVRDPLPASNTYQFSGYQQAIPAGLQHTAGTTQQPPAVAMLGGHSTSSLGQGMGCGRLETLFDTEKEAMDASQEGPTDIPITAAAGGRDEAATGSTGVVRRPVAEAAGATQRESVDLRAALRRKRMATDIAGQQANDSTETGGTKRPRQQARGAWY